MLGMLRVRRMTADRTRVDVSHDYAAACGIATDEQRRAFALSVASQVPGPWRVISCRKRAHAPDEYAGFTVVAQVIPPEEVYEQAVRDEEDARAWLDSIATATPDESDDEWDEYGNPRDEEEEERSCGSRGPEGYFCEEPFGHGGPHNAFTGPDRPRPPMYW